MVNFLGQLLFPVSMLNFFRANTVPCFYAEFFSLLYAIAKITFITARIKAPLHENVKLALEQSQIFKLIFTLSGATTVPCFYAEFFRGNYGCLFFVLNLSASCKISAGTKADFQADFHVVRDNYGSLFLWWIFQGNYCFLFLCWIFSGQIRFPISMLRFLASSRQLLKLRS